MPTYEYRCRRFGHLFEVFQGMTEDPLEACPKCEGPVERMMGPGAGLIFKGSGSYITDYRKNSTRTERSEGSEGGKSGDGSKDANGGAVK